MTTAKNQQHHEAELFTRILTRMARLTESVEGLNEEMDELRKVLDGMGGNGVDGGWSVSREFVYSIHPGACLNREPGGCDGDPVWSVVKHLEGPRISGSESTSWRMAWVYAAEILKAELDGFVQSPNLSASPVTYKDMVKEIYPGAGAVRSSDPNSAWPYCVSVNGRAIREINEMLSGWCGEERDAWENAASRITEKHKQIVKGKYKNGPTVTSCAKSDGTTNQYTHEVWVGDNFDGGHSTLLGSGQSEFAAWFAAARNCGLANEPVVENRKPISEWSTTPPTSSGFYWIATPDSDSYVIRFDARRKEFHFCGNEIDYEPSDFPEASYSQMLAPPGIPKP